MNSLHQPAYSSLPTPRPISKTASRTWIIRILILVAVIFTFRYFYWRVGDTMNPAAKWFFYFFLVAEILNFVEAALFYFTTWKPTSRTSPHALSDRSVDVFITTYNEPINLLRETVLC